MVNFFRECSIKQIVSVCLTKTGKTFHEELQTLYQINTCKLECNFLNILHRWWWFCVFHTLHDFEIRTPFYWLTYILNELGLILLYSNSDNWRIFIYGKNLFNLHSFAYCQEYLNLNLNLKWKELHWIDTNGNKSY